MILGGFDGQFQIPNNPGQPTLGFAVNGVTDFNSAIPQREPARAHAIRHPVAAEACRRHRHADLRLHPPQLAVFLARLARRSAVQRHRAAGEAFTTLRDGVQDDGSWRINDQHTLRAGFLVQQANAPAARPLRRCCRWTTLGRRPRDVPLTIANSFTKTGALYGMYVQDEWRILPKLTLNSGLRFDAVEEFTHESQVSPRINLVWKPTDTTTLNVGYARYFVPPPFELVCGHPDMRASSAPRPRRR